MGEKWFLKQKGRECGKWLHNQGSFSYERHIFVPENVKMAMMGVENYENESWGEKPEDLAFRNHMLSKQVKLIRKGLKQIKSM